jgi:2-methylcitrate dehydratase PrpD
LVSACGTQQPAVERCLAKRMQPAWAAHAGILAGLLAGSGISGPSESLEGEYGLYRMFERGDPTTIIQELGHDMRTSISVSKNILAARATTPLSKARSIWSSSTISCPMTLNRSR